MTKGKDNSEEGFILATRSTSRIYLIIFELSVFYFYSTASSYRMTEFHHQCLLKYVNTFKLKNKTKHIS